jgi:hypothetical protein
VKAIYLKKAFEEIHHGHLYENLELRIANCEFCERDRVSGTRSHTSAKQTFGAHKIRNSQFQIPYWHSVLLCVATGLKRC